jgi:hypothetical protein
VLQNIYIFLQYSFEISDVVRTIIEFNLIQFNSLNGTNTGNEARAQEHKYQAKQYKEKENNKKTKKNIVALRKQQHK